MCLDCACGTTAAIPAVTPASAPQPRRLALGRRLLQRNDEEASANREIFRAAGVRVINLLSSPGSGKTALLEALARAWPPQAPRPAVVVGDHATDNDARRLRAAGRDRGCGSTISNIFENR